jgi:nitroreductase
MTHPTSGLDTVATDALLTTTRSVRRRLELDRTVPRDLIEECIDVAMQAPMGGNVVRCRWMVVDDPELRSRIADSYREAYSPYRVSAQERSAAAGIDNSRITASADHLAEVLERVPVHLIPCHIAQPAGSDPFSLSTFYGSIMPAVWSLMLALRSRGLGSSLTTLHLQDAAEISTLLGIPETATQIALLPVGWYSGTDFQKVKRAPAGHVTYWNRWKVRNGADNG